MKNNTGKNSIIMLAADSLTADEIAAGAAEEWTGVRYEKQIAIFGDYINPLFPIETMSIDEAFADEMIANFAAKRKAHVTIPITHYSASDPSRNAGEVVELLKKDDGLYAVMEIKRWDSQWSIEDGTTLDVSMGFDWDYVDTRTGEHYGIVLEHVALENDPYIEGMSGFEKTQAQLDKEEAQRAMWEDMTWLDEFSQQHKGSAIMLSKKTAKELNMPKNIKQQKQEAAGKVTLSKVKNDREFDVTITVKDEDGEDVEQVVKAGEEVEVPEAQAETVTTQIADAEAPAADDDEEETPEEKEAREKKEAEDAAAAEEAAKKGEGTEKLSKGERSELMELRRKQKASDAKSAYATLLSAKKITPAQEKSFVELHQSLNGQKVHLSRDGKQTEVNLSDALVEFMNAGTARFSTDQSGSKKAPDAKANGKLSETLSDETAKGLAARGVTAERMDALAEKSPAYREAMSKLNKKDEE